MSRCSLGHLNLALQPLLLAALRKEKTIAHTDARVALNVLLSSRLVLVAHVHDCSGLAPVHFLAEKATKLFADLPSSAANRPLLARAILARHAHRVAAHCLLQTQGVLHWVSLFLRFLGESGGN